MRFSYFILLLVVSHTLTALIDVDGNKISDLWELKYFDRVGIQAERDSDFDGYTNAQESVLGTNPHHQTRYLRENSDPDNFELGHLDLNYMFFSGSNGEEYLYYYWWGIAGKKYTPLWSQDLMNYFTYKDSENNVLVFSPETSGELGYVIRIDPRDTDNDGEIDAMCTYEPDVLPPTNPMLQARNIQTSLKTSKLIPSSIEKPTIKAIISGGWYGYFSRIHVSIISNGQKYETEFLSDINLWSMVRGNDSVVNVELEDCTLKIIFCGGFEAYTSSEVSQYEYIIDFAFSSIPTNYVTEFLENISANNDNSGNTYMLISNVSNAAVRALAYMVMDEFYELYTNNKLSYFLVYSQWEQTRNRQSFTLQKALTRSIMRTMSANEDEHHCYWFDNEEDAIAERNVALFTFAKLNVEDIEEADGRTKAERLELSANDINNNGIIDWWEMKHFGHILTSEEIASGDADEDGISDIDEFHLGLKHTSDDTISYDANGMVIGIENKSNPITRDAEGNVTLYTEISLSQ